MLDLKEALSSKDEPVEITDFLHLNPQGSLIAYSKKFNLIFVASNESIRMFPIFGDLYCGFKDENLENDSFDVGQQVFEFNSILQRDERIQLSVVYIEGSCLKIGYRLLGIN